MSIQGKPARASRSDDPFSRLDLLGLIQWAIDHGDSITLRRFACWCARQTISSDNKWEDAVELAERYIKGEASMEALEAKRESLKGIAVAAGTTGHHYQAMNSYTMLACFQTLRPDAAEAALYASQEQWMWERLHEIEKDPSLTIKRSRGYGETIKRRQAKKLREMLGESKMPRWGGKAN